MIHRILWLVVSAVLWAGCTKKEQSSEVPKQPTAHMEKSAAPETPPEVQQAQDAVDAQPQTARTQAPLDAPPPAVVTQVSVPDGADATAPLTTALRRWIIAHKRLPRNFEEFSAGMQIPPPPAGKEYQIDKNVRVVLVTK